MRTIKFRARNLDGEWRYGFYVEEERQTINGFEKKHFIVNDGHRYVDPSTVGQFTGLLDKDGKEIYEGDILQETDSGKTVLVVYEAPEFCYADNIFGYRFLNLPENFSVIGNIHDNPELLRGCKQ